MIRAVTKSPIVMRNNRKNILSASVRVFLSSIDFRPSAHDMIEIPKQQAEIMRNTFAATKLSSPPMIKRGAVAKELKADAPIRNITKSVIGFLPSINIVLLVSFLCMQ